MTATDLDVEELADLIRYHNELYFNDDAEITDAEFDILIAQMKDVGPDHEVLSEVGADPTYGKKVTHPALMGSLDKATYDEDEIYGISELIAWVVKVAAKGIVICVPKIDGLAVRLVYKKGKLILAATRGNGTVGQDVTDNVKNIESIPNEIPDFSGELRGEIYMKKSDFKALRDKMIEDGKKVPANPRNMASGTLNQKDPKKTARHPLYFFCYDITLDNGESFSSEDYKWEYTNKRLPGIEFVDLTILNNTRKESLLEQINRWEKDRDSLDYNIDGLVFLINDVALMDELGYKGRCPVGKIAFKFRPVQAEAIIEDIVWQLGRTGRLTPVAQISKTLLDGSTIDSPTLHNYAQIIKKGISIGSRVIIEKAGDIIPQVVRVVKKKGSDINLPLHCPACLDDVELDEKKVSLWCINPACPGRAEFSVIHYLKTLEVRDVGPATVHTMLQHDIITDLASLYNIDYNKLSMLPGFGKKSARKVVTEIFEKIEVELSVFLDSLGIHGLGTTTSKIIADKYEELSVIRDIKKDEFKKIDGIGPIISHSIESGLHKLEETIDNLIAAGVVIKDKKKVTGSMTGMTFCVTGTLSVGRKDMHALIEAAGGTIKSSVGKGLDYLVAGDGVGAGKTGKAEKWGTKVIDENEVRSMMA